MRQVWREGRRAVGLFLKERHLWTRGLRLRMPGNGVPFARWWLLPSRVFPRSWRQPTCSVHSQGALPTLLGGFPPVVLASCLGLKGSRVRRNHGNEQAANSSTTCWPGLELPCWRLFLHFPRRAWQRWKLLPGGCAWGPGRAAGAVRETPALVRSSGRRSQPRCPACEILGKSFPTGPFELPRGNGMMIYGCPGFLWE